jgi:hypothetical protein
MILHVDGSTVPGAPLEPEYIKTDVYLPPNLVNEFPQTHPTIARIVQQFIEGIGLPTISRWKEAARSVGWSLTQSGHVNTPPADNAALIPSQSSRSAHYIFRGRRRGTLEYMLSQQPLADPTIPSASQESNYGDMELPIETVEAILREEELSTLH